MEQKGLVFIPDISGFSRFVTETEIGHSRLIIQELLEILINANEIGLEISEIEGDAILFYKFGELPSLEALYRQVRKMFCDFHENLLAYDLHRYCQCKACMSAKGLTLKAITHYGEFTGYNVRNFQKLIGKDIIVAHQLLKNDIPEHEYWIITRNVSEHPLGLTQWMRWDTSVKHAETGDIPFHYTHLGSLRRQLRPAGRAPLDLENMTKVFSIQKRYDASIIKLFHASGDFQHRHKWQEGVKEVHIINHYLPRVGMKCRCVIDGKDIFIYSSSYRYQEDRIEFTETEESGMSLTWFTLERVLPQIHPFPKNHTSKPPFPADGKPPEGAPVQAEVPPAPEGKAVGPAEAEPAEAEPAEATLLTLDYYARRNVASQLMFKLFRKGAIEKQYRKSLENLVPLVRELKIPGTK